MTGSWKEMRELLIERVRQRVGTIPSGSLDLCPQEVARREYATHTEVKLTYQGQQDERIPAYLLIPRATSGLLPAVFAAHQCAWKCDVGKEQVVGKCVDMPDQAYGLELVREGFIVLAPDANKVGERYDQAMRRQWQTAEIMGHQRFCCLAEGGPWASKWKTVFDVIRGIDFLTQHERVDPSRIGMIGHSLGGDTTLWTLPFEPRIRAVAISGSGLIMDWPGGGPYGVSYADLLCLIAPLPLLEVTGQRDYTNCQSKDPLPSVDERMARKREAHAVAKEVYTMLGHPDALGCFEFDGGHVFPETARKAAYAWLKRWLKVGA